MHINSIGANYSIANARRNPSFGKMYVTLSEKNNASYVEKEVVDNFKQDLYPGVKKNRKVAEFQRRYGDKMNCFLLAAGAGSRFKQLAQTQGEEVNKVSYKYYLYNGKTFHMPDTNLARAAHYMKNDKIHIVTAKDANGSLGQVIETYMRDGEPIKDTVIYCGDNQLHTQNPLDIDRFFVKAMGEGNKMALIAARKTPEEVADSFGCMLLDDSDRVDGLYNLEQFEEKPKLERAYQLADSTGSCYANAGMFVFSKEAIEFLIEGIKNDPKFIAKDDKEVYDFALAQKKILDEFGPSECIVKVVDGKDWLDTGKPNDFQQFLEEVRDEGKYLNVFSLEDQDGIRGTMVDKVGDGFFINQKQYMDKFVDEVTEEDIENGIKLDDNCILIN